jgi:hypothetical protein
MWDQFSVLRWQWRPGFLGTNVASVCRMTRLCACVKRFGSLSLSTTSEDAVFIRDANVLQQLGHRCFPFAPDRQPTDLVWHQSVGCVSCVESEHTRCHQPRRVFRWGSWKEEDQ